MATRKAPPFASLKHSANRHEVGGAIWLPRIACTVQWHDFALRDPRAVLRGAVLPPAPPPPCSPSRPTPLILVRPFGAVVFGRTRMAIRRRKYTFSSPSSPSWGRRRRWWGSSPTHQYRLRGADPAGEPPAVMQGSRSAASMAELPPGYRADRRSPPRPGHEHPGTTATSASASLVVTGVCRVTDDPAGLRPWGWRIPFCSPDRAARLPRSGSASGSTNRRCSSRCAEGKGSSAADYEACYPATRWCWRCSSATAWNSG